MRKRQFTVSDRQDAMLTTLSAYLDVPASELVRRALDSYLPDELRRTGASAVANIDMTKEEFTRAELDAILLADGRPWIPGRNS